MTIKKFAISFIEFVPKIIDENTIYVSIPYKVIVHNCPCGCGNKVSLPIDKKDGWILKYDGENISIYPSIGNWDLPCKSHYYITENTVMWSSSWEEYEKSTKNKKKKNKQRKQKKKFRKCHLFCK